MKNKKTIEEEILEKYVEAYFDRKCKIITGIIGLIALILLGIYEVIFQSNNTEDIIPRYIAYFWIILFSCGSFLYFSTSNGEKTKKKMLSSLSEKKKEAIILKHKKNQN